MSGKCAPPVGVLDDVDEPAEKSAEGDDAKVNPEVERRDQGTL